MIRFLFRSIVFTVVVLFHLMFIIFIKENAGDAEQKKPVRIERGEVHIATKPPAVEPDKAELHQKHEEHEPVVTPPQKIKHAEVQQMLPETGGESAAQADSPPAPDVQEVSVEKNKKPVPIVPESIDSKTGMAKTEVSPPARSHRPVLPEPSKKSERKESQEEERLQMINLYESVRGAYMPRLHITFENANQHRDALNYFGFRLVARAESNPHVYFIRSPSGAVARRNGKCPYEGWCLEALPGDKSFFLSSRKTCEYPR